MLMCVCVISGVLICGVLWKSLPCRSDNTRCYGSSQGNTLRLSWFLHWKVFWTTHYNLIILVLYFINWLSLEFLWKAAVRLPQTPFSTHTQSTSTALPLISTTTSHQQSPVSIHITFSEVPHNIKCLRIVRMLFLVM